MKFYYIKDDYIDFLRKYDSIVAENKQESRPYVGTVVEIEGHKYYAPFTSPKPKHQKMKNSLDFRKIENGSLGAINFNNMIPVVDSAIIPIKFNEIIDLTYRKLLEKQYIAINKDSNNIERIAKKLREIVFSSNDKLTKQERKVKSRCCNMSLLEEKSKEYERSSSMKREKTDKIEKATKNVIDNIPNTKKEKARVSIKEKLPEMKEKSEKLFGKSQLKQQDLQHKNKTHHEEL